MLLEGIHHITAITADAPGNVEFYTGVLGLRMVKQTVNQDDPTVYHLFYGDDDGSPGMDLTFFEYPGAARGRPGAGMVHRIVWRVGSAAALQFWNERLEQHGVSVEFDGESLVFADPEGLEHELVPAAVSDAPLQATSPEVPAEYALQGFDGVRAYSTDPTASAGLLLDGLGFETSDGRTWEVRGERRGSFYAYDNAPPEAVASQGAGTVHHVAFASSIEDHERWRTARGGGGRAHNAGDRPLLLSLGLLPRAQRRAVRARDDRSRLRRRRGRRAPGRAAVAARRASSRCASAWRPRSRLCPIHATSRPRRRPLDAWP